MKLKSFGCSFIFGTDLHDDNSHRNCAKASDYTWPALLAQQHNLDYYCYARPGAGNLEIVEHLLSQLADVEPAVYVVGWTWIDRFSYFRKIQKYGQPAWTSIMPVDTDAQAEMYYKHLHSETRDKLTSLLNVKIAIDALRNSGNKFIMTYMDDLMFDQRWNTTPAISVLQGYCEPYMTRFNGQSFLEYAKENGFEISQTQHPLEAAHQAAAELINSYNLL